MGAIVPPETFQIEAERLSSFPREELIVNGKWRRQGK